MLTNIVASCTYDVIWDAQPSNVCKRDYDPFPPAGVCMETHDTHVVHMDDPVDYSLVVIRFALMVGAIQFVWSARTHY